jgi:HEAT repeat protein
VEALGKLKDRRAVAELIPFLQDGDAQVRGRAAAALSAITGQSFGEDAERWRAWLQADAA